MQTQILKTILVGILVGAGLFFAPFFLLRAAFFVLLIFGLFRLFRGRYGWGHRYSHSHGGFHPAFADTIRSMSEEEYSAFRQKLEQPWGGSRPRKDENAAPQTNA